MSAPTLTPLAPAVGLMPPGFDPRPCVNKPPQWWDLGDEHNPRAIRFCRNVCPRLAACKAEIADGTVVKPKGQIRGGAAYNENGKRVSICGACDQPRHRASSNSPIVCGCPSKPTREQMAAERRADREATRAAKLAAKQAKTRQLQGIELVDVWVPLHCAGLNIRQAAERLGVRHGTLKNALHRARAAGDRRVPHFRAARTERAAA